MNYLWSVSGLDLREEGSEEHLQLAHAVSRRKVSIMLWAVNEEKVNAYLKMLIASDKTCWRTECTTLDAWTHSRY